MKRSEINKAIKEAIELLEKNNFRLPSFAYFTMDEWKGHKDKLDTISRVMLGWDITDFGSGRFEEVGAVLFTLRNGDVKDKSVGTPYAEKVIILKDEKEQQIPMHCHRVKTEDIINRGGGVMCIQLYGSDSDGNIDKSSDIEVYMDGIKHTFKAGEILEIEKGNSITLTPGLYHCFWAKKGTGDLIAGEVSSVNDDNIDNIFVEPADRFSEIEEDEDILHPLVNEYHKI